MAASQAHSQSQSQYVSVKEKTQQCIFCKEWKQAGIIDSHQRNCPYNNKENEEMKQVNSNGSTIEVASISSKKNSLLQILNSAQNEQVNKAKRLLAFKKQLKEQIERQVDPIDYPEIEDP